MGQGRSSPALFFGCEPGGILRSRWRGRFLRPQGRFSGARCARAGMAAFNHPGGFHPTCSPGPDLYWRGWPGTYPGRVAPGGNRINRTLPGCGDRAFRRRFPRLAGACPGGSDSDRRPPCGIRPPGRRKSWAQPVCASRWMTAANG